MVFYKVLVHHRVRGWATLVICEAFNADDPLLHYIGVSPRDAWLICCSTRTWCFLWCPTIDQ